MKKHLKLINLICLIILGIIVSLTSVFAWSVFTDNAKSLKLQVTKIDSEIYLYQGLDKQSNGVPDFLSEYTESEINNIKANYPVNKTEYYNENRAFSYIGKQSAMSMEPSASEILNYDLGLIYPTQSKTLKFSVVNNSDGANYISFTFDYKSYTEEYIKVLKTMSFRVARIENNGALTDNPSNIVLSDKYYFGDYITGNNFNGLDFLNDSDDYKVEGQISKNSSKNDDCLDLWFIYQMEDFESLKEHGIYLTDEEKEDYSLTQGISIELPNLKINLELRVK
jgi:hypothetical protein